MQRWRRLIPEWSLSGTRLVAVSIGGLTVLAQLGGLGNPLRSAAYLRVSAFSILLIFGLLVLTYLRARTQWWCVVPLPIAIAVAGSGLYDPVAATSIGVACMLVLSLYGSTRMWATRTLGTLIAVPAGVAISPRSVGRDLDWNSPTVLSILPQMLLMAVMMRVIYLTLTRQERNAEREALLSRAGQAMLGVTDFEQIREVGRRALHELAALNPGVVLMVLRPGPAGLWVSSIAGAAPELRGRTVPDDLLTDPTALPALFPGFVDWYVDGRGADLAPTDLIIVVGSVKRVPMDLVDVFRTLAHQVMLGEKGCRAHAELEHRAHHDHLTQLPTRAKFARELEHALGTAPAGTVALLNVDLDDFKQVNDSYGHAAGDELLCAVAARMSEVAGGHGLAARFGGDEFALLLTGLNAPADAEHVAELLCARLTAPVPVSLTTTVTAGASIGVAVAAPGVSATELTRQADMAMYAAKTGGKNRIEKFRPTHEHLPA
ncbi:diguanylate cyclase domain-containing protein [Micromonosporaceae bacterium Da 78-11]